MITQIPRQQAKTFLSKIVSTRTAFGVKFKTSRHRRGPGGAADLINYGYGDPPRIVMRIGPAPFGNRPVLAALGKDLASYGAYVMRLAGAGVTAEEMENFVKACALRFRVDMLSRERDFRYLVSLDDPNGWLIEAASILESPAYAGKIYQKAGFLSGGFSKTRRQPTQFVDTDGQLRSIYSNGKNLLTAGLLPAGARLVDSGPKRRFVRVLAEKGSLEYAAWRRVLPAHVVELQEDPLLDWVQPRLLIKKGAISWMIRMMISKPELQLWKS